MKKSHCVIIFFAFTICSNAQTGKEIFMQNFCTIDDILNGKLFELHTLDESRNFLIDITGITYQIENPFDPMILPPEKIMKAWKQWFDENENKLYWDKNRKKVIVKAE